MDVQHMKWWGWGDEGIAFSHEDKPKLAPFVMDQIGLDLDARTASPPALDDLDVPEPVLDERVATELRTCVGAANVDTSDLDRVTHTYGKSIRDLVRIRAGDLGRVPDVVVYPGSEEEVEALVALSATHDLVLVPFGGGTNISGSLEAPRTETRTVVSIDMGRLTQVLDVDETSGLARIQAGVLGPDMERQLNDRGWTLGHFPDSFNHSTLGGWIATRSSGMQSDKYGDIADMTRGLRMVSPGGVVAIRPVPVTSTGPSIREMILGSEGRLGIITEATVQVHRTPEERTILGYFFRTFSEGLAAMAEIAAADVHPTVTRVSDSFETQFSLATSKSRGLRSTLESAALKTFLSRVKGWDSDKICLSFIGFEGSPAYVKEQRGRVGDIVKRHNGLCVGSGPGELYDQKKFDTPYIRDFLLDRGSLADVSETAAPWSRLQEVYDAATGAARKTFAELGVRGFVMCHLSHSYRSGACLYFTFAIVPNDRIEPIEQYDAVKRAVQQAFVDHGATLSHHHGVGVEHSPWMEQDVSPAGVGIVRALFDGVDPDHRLNPGKIVPDA